jgi:DNA-binding response OmpR family regulator
MSAEGLLRREPFDLVLLDLNLPDQDGLMLARKLSAEHSLPLVILTGRADEVDRVLGLELGADDYVTKPFSPRELLARLRAVLRRTQMRASPRSASPQSYRFANFELRMGTRKLITPQGKALDLTGGEFSLLAAFLRSPQRILSRDQLLEASRLYDDVYDRSIDVQILRLRRKIEADPTQPALIKTQRGAGYYLDCTVEQS